MLTAFSGFSQQLLAVGPGWGKVLVHAVIQYNSKPSVFLGECYCSSRVLFLFVSKSSNKQKDFCFVFCHPVNESCFGK